MYMKWLGHVFLQQDTGMLNCLATLRRQCIQKAFLNPRGLFSDLASLSEV